jgi:hypothetical protein
VSAGSPEENFARLLDETAAALAALEGFPDDELHREILLPLLPALLADTAIRKYWSARGDRGIFASLGNSAGPRWAAGDFEIPVAASYSAGPDAKALADTLLSEADLRDLAAALLNQLAIARQKPAAQPPVRAGNIRAPRERILPWQWHALPRRRERHREV